MSNVEYNDNIHYAGAISPYEPRVNMIDLFESLTDMHKAVLRIRMDNPNIQDTEIARLLGVSKQRVDRINKQIKRKYAKLMP
jgi:DNA-directed RNA polymerase specialized sigma subunit